MAENFTPIKSGLMDKLVSLTKRRGFIYPGSEIYGGLANTYDYGPVGTELLRNIKNLWWKKFVQDREDVVGLDASIISHHKIWDASGHTSGFSDALIDCKKCKNRVRADHLIEEWLENNTPEINKSSSSEERVDKSESSRQARTITDKAFEEAVDLKKVEGGREGKMEEFI